MKRVVILLLLQLTCAVPISSAQSETGNEGEQSFKAGMIDESTGNRINHWTSIPKKMSGIMSTIGGIRGFLLYG